MSQIPGFELNPKNIADAPTLILAHGAGAPADSPFMESLAENLRKKGIATVRFEFPYMQRRREDGRKRPPDSQKKLLAHFREVVDQVVTNAPGPVFVGGKSMGGRMASLLMAEAHPPESVHGCLCFGYPFHPPGKTDRWRVEHFAQLRCPLLILQGTRDPFGKQEETDWAAVMGNVDGKIQWLEGGNHDFKPLAKQPETQDQLIASAAAEAAAFMLNKR